MIGSRRITGDRLASWLLATLATVAALAMAWRRSGEATVLGRYSVVYTMMLALVVVNVGIMWWHTAGRVSLVHRIRQLRSLPVGRLIVTLGVTALLVDTVSPRPLALADLVNVALFGAVLVQLQLAGDHVTVWPRRLAVLVCSLLVGLVLVELLFAFFLVESRIPKTHAEFIRLMTVKAESTNGRGLLTVPWQTNVSWAKTVPLAKAAGTIRILGLSDSFGLAGGPSGNYHYRLQTLLNRDVSPTVEVINISVDGYEPRHQLNILRFGMEYSPDIVLHGFFVGNDFRSVPETMYVYREIPITLGVNRYRPRRFFIRSWIENALWVVHEGQRRQQEIAAGVVHAPGSWSQAAYLELQLRRIDLWGRLTPQTRERIEAVFSTLDEIRSMAEGGGGRYVLVVHPDEMQVDDALRQAMLGAAGRRDDEIDLDLPQRALRAYCTDRGVACIDLLPVFRAAAAQGLLYMPRDSHYNARGNQLAAQRIRDYLIELLPGKATAPASVAVGGPDPRAGDR